MVRFAFHQIVLANSIQNLPFILRLTESFDRILRNHFRTPIPGTTRLARRAAAHQYWITERAESDAAERDEGERTCHHIATSTDHLTVYSANP